MLSLDDIGIFTYCWGWDFHIETVYGNFHWKDPDYNGDNTITPCEPYPEFVKRILGKNGYGRDKGKHRIRDYCGEEVKINV